LASCMMTPFNGLEPAGLQLGLRAFL
jgi:hypothetical protein